MVFELRDLAVVQDRLDAVSGDALKDTNSLKRKRNYTTTELQDTIKAKPEEYSPPLIPQTRSWGVTNQEYLSYSPIRLFLLLFQPVFEILLYHTNLAIQHNNNPSKACQPIQSIELRRWIACRLEIFRRIPLTAEMNDFWSFQTMSSQYLSRKRYYDIEHFLSLNSDPLPSNRQVLWHWKVTDAMNALRIQLKRVLTPPSHLAVDESTIKFIGRCTHTYLTPHKPAREGFVFYALVGQDKLMLDFVVTSPKEGVETYPKGITIDIPNRTLRHRKQGTTGATATQISLPPTKALVYTLCEGFLRQYSH